MTLRHTTRQLTTDELGTICVNLLDQLDGVYQDEQATGTPPVKGNDYDQQAAGIMAVYDQVRSEYEKRGGK